MIVGIPYKLGLVFQHFGHTEQFMLFTIEDNKIVDEKLVNTNCGGHGALAGFLKDNNVNVVICGGIGGGAKNALAECGIEIYGGVSGGVRTVISQFINKTLNYNNDLTCSHHDSSDHHDCGSDKHGCSGC